MAIVAEKTITILEITAKIVESCFEPGQYELELKEYQKILTFTSEEKNRHNFGLQRAFAFNEIGEMHLMIVDETFKQALLEEVSLLDKKMHRRKN